MDHVLDNLYNNIPRHHGRRGNFAAGDLTDANDDGRAVTMLFRKERYIQPQPRWLAHANLTGYDERYSSMLDARGLTGTGLSRDVFRDAAIRVIRNQGDNENWPIDDGFVGGGGPGGPGGGVPRGGGGGDRRGGRGGDRRSGGGDGRRDSRGGRYGPGSGSKRGKFERRVKSTNTDTKMTKHESSDVVEDIEPILVITKHYDGTNKHYRDTNGNRFWNNEKKKEVVSLLSKRFWMGGEDESCGNNSDMVIPPGGMDHLRVHPPFLHSNAIRHKFNLVTFLVKQVQNAKEKIKKLDEQHEALVGIDSDELMQFWMAGEDESCGNNSDMVIPPAFTERLDNPLDEEDVTDRRTQKKYPSTNCQHIGYAEHIKSVPDAKPEHLVGDISTGINTNGSKTEVVWPIRNIKALKLVEYEQYDATPEAYASTSRKSLFKVSTSSKVLNTSTNSVPLKVNRYDVFPDNHVKKVGRSVIQDDTGDNFGLTAKDAVVSHNIDNVEKVVNFQKSKWEEESMSFTEILDWVANAARNPHNRAFEASQRNSKWKNYTGDKLWKQALLARHALFEELLVDSSNETNGLHV
nr:AT-rich interactive domain-containing protein 2-like [Tanacetum cinerariifolium]